MPEETSTGTTSAAELKEGAKRGATATAAAQVASIVLQFGGIVILGRRLTPDDYGLVAMVTSVIGVASLFRDLGLTSGSIQARKVSRQLQTNLFWINAGAGAGAAVLICAAAEPIALMYGDHRVVPVTLALSSVFLFSGVGAQFRADLARRLRFKGLAVIDVSSSAIALVAAVVLAWMGASYWALVAQQVINALIPTICLVLSAGWLPGRYSRAEPVIHIARFGGALLASQLLTYATTNADTFIVGLRLGPTQLGVYDRAFKLLNVPLNQLRVPATRVSLPILARVQDDRKEFARFVLRGQQYLIHILMALSGLAMAAATAAVPIALGSQWTAAVRPFEILCIAAMAQLANYPAYWCFMATGQMKLSLRYGVFTRPLVVALFFAGSYFGTAGVAAGATLGLVANWLSASWWLRKVPIIPDREMLSAATRGVLVYGIAGTVGAVAASAVHGTAISGLAGAGAFFVLVALALGFPVFRHEAVSTWRSAVSLFASAVRPRIGRLAPVASDRS